MTAAGEGAGPGPCPPGRGRGVRAPEADVGPGAEVRSGADVGAGVPVTVPVSEVEAAVPAAGAFAVDGRDGRVGRVVERSGDQVRLRPPGGGPEWACPAEDVQPASPGAVLRARVTEINREGQLPR